MGRAFNTKKILLLQSVALLILCLACKRFTCDEIMEDLTRERPSCWLITHTFPQRSLCTRSIWGCRKFAGLLSSG